MNLKDDNPMSGLDEFQQLFAQAEQSYGKGEYIPVDGYPSFSQMAGIALPRGYFVVDVEDVERFSSGVRMTLISSKGMLPTGRSGQYVSLKIAKDDADSPYISTVKAYFCRYPEAKRWNVWIPAAVAEQCPDLRDAQAGARLLASRPMGEFGYNDLRDGRRVVGVCRPSTVAPFLAMADGIAKGRYDFCMEVHCVGTDKDVRQWAETTPGQGVAWHWHAEGALPSAMLHYRVGDSVFVALYDANDVNGEMVKAIDAERKFVRCERCYPATQALDVSRICHVKVRCFAGEYTIVGVKGQRLVDALERAHIAVQSRCLDGQCGWCKCRLLSGAVDVLPHDAMRAADKVNGSIHACAVLLKEDIEIAIDY